MRLRARALTIFTLLLLLGFGDSPVSALSLEEDPLHLSNKISKAARDIVAGNPQRLDGRLPGLVANASIYALLETSLDPLKELQINLAETARTDRQVGGGSSSVASTSLTVKAGINRLLGLAIENGAVQQQSDVTGLTLSTSPYAFVIMPNGGDTQTNFDRFSVWRRFGMSATFKTGSGEAATIGDLDVSDVSEIGFRARILGDRSTRTAGFLEVWKREVQGGIQKSLNLQEQAMNDIFDQHTGGSSALGALAEDGDESPLYQEILEQWQAHVAEHDSDSKEKKEEAVRDIILQALTDMVYEPVKQGELLTNEATRQSLRAELFPDLTAAIRDEAKNRARIPALAKSYNQNQSLLTFDYALHRIDGGSDFSELKFVYQNFLDPFDLTLNAFVNLNHESTLLAGRDVIREYGATFSAEGNIENFFGSMLGQDNRRPITLALSGKVSHLKDVNDEVFGFQAKAGIPFTAGLTLPIAFNYSSRTETSTKDEFRFTVGVGIEFDSILAAVRARNLADAILGSAQR